MKFLNRIIRKKILEPLQPSDDEKLIASSSLFDAQYYIKNYMPENMSGDINMAKNKAIRHFLTEGVKCGLNPSDDFNTVWYLSRYKDVAHHGMNPLVHYLQFGKEEGRRTKPPIIDKAESQLKKRRNDLVFFSSRTDGFGERLKSLLNAMVLADYFNSDFKFTWAVSSYLGETHAVSSPEETFSDTFIASHMVNQLPENVVDLSDVENLVFPKTHTALNVKVSQVNLFRLYPSLDEKISDSVFADAFRKINFSIPILEAINLANNICLPESCVSIHLRSGDIVYGRYRFDDRYTNKVISYAQADYLINTFNKNNTKVVLFGQNESVCHYFAEKYDCLYFGGDKSVAALSSLQQAIFDMVLMSRTNKIYAGNSGFSQLAELIGKAKICSAEDDFDQKQMAEYIGRLLDSDEVKKFDDFQNAFSCWHYVFHFNGVMSQESAIKYLNKAITFTGDCLFYHIVLSSYYYLAGYKEEAEANIDYVIKKKNEKTDVVGDYNYLTKFKYSDGKCPLYKYRGVLLQMSKDGISGAGEIFRDSR